LKHRVNPDGPGLGGFSHIEGEGAVRQAQNGRASFAPSP
jgi:hypothetical protein